MKLLHILALATGVFFVLMSGLFADDSKPAASGGLATGTGRLTAAGDGTVQVTMLEGTATVSGSGVLWVTSGATVTQPSPAPASGQAASQPLVWTEQTVGAQQVKICTNFYGDATISGEKYSINLRGNGINMTAQGIGKANLQGTGTYALELAGKKKDKTGKWGGKPKVKVNMTDPTHSQISLPKLVIFGSWPSDKNAPAAK